MPLELFALLFPALAAMAAGFNELVRRAGRDSGSMAYTFGVYFPSLMLASVGAMMVAAFLASGSENAGLSDRFAGLWPFAVGWLIAVGILWRLVWRRRPSRANRQ